MTSMSERVFLAALSVMALGLVSTVHAQGSRPEAASATLFQNVRIFDGKGGSLSAPSNVLVKGNTIERISTSPMSAEQGVAVVAGGGRTLMPGLIDAHWHAMLASMPIAAMRTADIGYLNLLAGEQATRTLHRGFTTVRDAGGPSFGLKRAIDDGTVAWALSR